LGEGEDTQLRRERLLAPPAPKMDLVLERKFGNKDPGEKSGRLSSILRGRPGQQGSWKGPGMPRFYLVC
jgi:hypothetical protein